MSGPDRLEVLTLSDLYPSPLRPADGIFVERQVHYLGSYTHQTVVVPLRVFPPARLWRDVARPARALREWRDWVDSLRETPNAWSMNGVDVYFPRYTSPPRRLTHGLWGLFAYGSIVPTLRNLHRQRRFQLLHAHYASPAGVVALLARRWMHVPVVVSVHGADVTFTATQPLLGERAVRWVFENADAILANSTWTANRILSLGAAPQKVRVVRLGANPPEGLVVPQGIDRADCVRLLSVGFLTERKGHRYVIEALKDLVDRGYRVSYTIVGDGPLEDTLRQQVHQLGLSGTVTFAGYKRHEDVWSHLGDCDIFVLPSWKEAFGLVYIEALSLGKPVVACRGEGGPEDIRSLGDCLELVSPRDAMELARVLQGLMDNPQRRASMGLVGRSVVREHFTWEANAANTWRVYKELWEQPHAC